VAPKAETKSGSGTESPISWDVLGKVVGTGAAIAGWIAVVGGARVWARLYAADIPATQTLSVLPRELLVVEGLQTLLVPLLIGGVAALFVYYSWPEEDKRRELESEARTAEHERRKVAAEEKRSKDAPEEERGKRQTSAVLGATNLRGCCPLARLRLFRRRAGRMKTLQ
jgi:hypothetical protein